MLWEIDFFDLIADILSRKELARTLKKTVRLKMLSQR